MRTAMFIDGSNLYATAKALSIDIDFKKLLTAFGADVRAMYYTALLQTEEYSTIRPLIDWLGYNGYTVVTKPVKEFVDAQGKRKIKGNMDVEIVVDALELAEHLDHLILFSGDGDFVPLVHSLHRSGVRVTVVSATQPSSIADELRRAADTFIELNDLRVRIQRGEQLVSSRYSRG